MTAATLGQLATVFVIAVAAGYVLGAQISRIGLARGWRARDAKGGAVRIDVPPMRVVRGSYRSRKTPITFPIPVDPDHQSHVDH